MVDHKADLFARIRRPLPLTSPRGVMALAAPLTPASLRDAATVILLRDAPGGVEAYLVKRAKTMAFAGGLYAYPGGRVDPSDGEDDVPWSGPSATELMAPFAPRDSGLARALVCTAVRETFEECGVLLAAPAGDPDGAVEQVEPGWGADRRALERRELRLADLLSRRGLVLRADLLVPWARWITPEVEPRRYDTHFFMAALPPGQSPGEASGEADGTEWVSPADALERHAAGRMLMLPPTASMLADLVGFAAVAEVLAAARDREIPPIMPKIVVADDAVHFLLPHDPEYAETTVPADAETARTIIEVTAAGHADRGAWTGARDSGAAS